MAFVKQLARKVIFPTLMGLGIDHLIRKSSDNGILNVMYHGVVEDDCQYFSPRHITKAQFEEHLKYYNKYFNVISIPEAFDNINHRVQPSKKSITISFDDGFKNNLYTALPLLEKHNIPATFFVLGTCAVENDTPCVWAAFTRTLNYFYRGSIIKVGKYRFVDQYDKENDMYLENYIKSLDFDERDKLLSRLIKTYDLKEKLKTLPEEIWSLLNRKELLELSKSNNILIGSHGHLHYNLGDININNARTELQNSKTLLESVINKKVNMIAYPDGSYSKQVKDIAEQIGYQYQLAVDYKTSDDPRDNRIMNRHGLSTTTTFESNMIMLNRAFRSKGIRT